MAGFDYEGALAAGYSPTEIVDHFSRAQGFDAAGARAAGYSDEEILQSLRSREQSQQQLFQRTPDTFDRKVMEYLDGNVGAGIAETLTTLGTGAVAQPLSGVAGLGAYAAKAAGFDVDPADVVESVQGALTYQPRTGGARAALGVLGMPFEALARGADSAGQAVADATGMPSLGAAARTGIEALPMLLGARGAPKALATRPSPQNASQALLEARGVPLTLADKGSQVMASMERAADTVFGPSRGRERQLNAWNQAVLDEVGVKANRGKADSAVMEDLFEKELSGDYARIHSVGTKADPQMAAELASFEKDLPLVLDSVEAAPLLRNVKDIRQKLQAHAGELPGSVAQHIRSRLGRMRSNPNHEVGAAARELQTILDRAYERSAPPELAQLSRDTRRRYHRALIIDRSTDPFGNVSYKRFYNEATKDKNAAAGLADLATAGRQVLPDHMANSGTPTRGADVGKVVGALQHPWELTKALGTILGGRMLNEHGSSIAAGAGRAAGSRLTDAGLGVTTSRTAADQAEDFFEMLERLREEREERMRRGY